jgi:hypothetical protein
MSTILSPGFFDPIVPLKNEEEQIVPEAVRVDEIADKHPKEENIIFKTFNMLFIVTRDCGCTDSWKRTSTY